MFRDDRPRVNDDGYLAGPPELIVEVAASSTSIDLRDKRRACCRNGVREYLIWLVAEARLEWFCLEDDDYRPQLPDAQGVLHSRVFPGLRRPGLPRNRAAARALPGRSAAAARLRSWRWGKTARKPANPVCCRPPPALAGWGRNE